MDLEQFEKRKKEHLSHALSPENQASHPLEQIELIHDALPELDLNEVSLKTPCFGLELLTPFYIAGMTAGHEEAKAINFVLAEACSQRGWALGVGSQRRELVEQSFNKEWKLLRQRFSDLVLIGNIGLSQLREVSIDQLKQLVSNLEAQALAVHANVLQEALQIEGTPHFKGALKLLEKLNQELGVPLILKETGCGFSALTLKKLTETGLKILDVSGKGGTHWGRIEGSRAIFSHPLSLQARTAKTFENWGVSTVKSVWEAKKILPQTSIWASGGVRTGLDAAKFLALGADRVGFAQPALVQALKGVDALMAWMEEREFELRVALFCTGSLSPRALKGKWEPTHV